MASDTVEADFKLAMRRLATTIAIVTSGTGDDRTGMAATAVTSVTADPPTILVAVNRTSSISPVLARDGRFCVNLLAERHAPLVGIFSGQKKGLDRFSEGGWQISAEGLAVLPDAVACLVCRNTMAIEVATHTLFIGEVLSVENHPTIDPLIWVDGGFASASPLA